MCAVTPLNKRWLIRRRELRTNVPPRSSSGLSPDSTWEDTLRAASPESQARGFCPRPGKGTGDPGLADLGGPGKAAGGARPRWEDAATSKGRQMRSDRDSTPGRTGAWLPARAVLEPTARVLMGSVCSAVTQWESLSTCHLEDRPACGRQNGSPLE